MKRKYLFLISLLCCLFLSSCGSPDKQPAMDALDQATEAFHTTVAQISERQDTCSEEVLSGMNDMEATLSECQKKLTSDTNYTQKELEEIQNQLWEVKNWSETVQLNFDLDDLNEDVGNIHFY